jgi:uncharacterized protein (DUF433 family)
MACKWPAGGFQAARTWLPLACVAPSRDRVGRRLAEIGASTDGKGSGALCSYVVGLCNFFNCRTLFGMDLCRVAPVNAARHELGTTAHETLVLVAPLDEFHVARCQLLDLPACHNLPRFPYQNGGRSHQAASPKLNLASDRLQPQEIGCANSAAPHYSSTMNRITTDPEQCGGRSCIRGMRIRVTDVLDLLSSGLTSQQVLEELPDLELEDIRACLQYASRKLNHPVLVTA